jgi:hypothetical protein
MRHPQGVGRRRHTGCGYRGRVSVWQTVLVFVVAPLGGLGLLALMVFGLSSHQPQRYRPGKSWEHEPVWYVPRPEADAPVASSEGRAGIAAAAKKAELAAADAAPAAVLDAPVRTARGGADGDW